MPSSLLSTALSKPSLSIIGNDGSNVAVNLKVSRVVIKLSSIVMRHMLETGSTIVDTRIVQPTRIQIDVFVTTFNDLTLVNGLLLDRTQTYTVSSKGLVFAGMMAEGEAIRQTAEVISANPVRISLKQLLLPPSAKPQVAQAADSSLLDLGLQGVQTAVISAQQLATSLVANAYVAAKTVVSGAMVDSTGNSFTLDSSELD